MIRRLLALALLVPSLAWASCYGPDSYSATICGDGPFAYYRLGDGSGTNCLGTAADQTGAFAGTYGNSYSCGQTGAIFGNGNTAAKTTGDTFGNLLISGGTTAFQIPVSGTFSVEFWGKAATGNCAGLRLITKDSTNPEWRIFVNGGSPFVPIFQSFQSGGASHASVGTTTQFGTSYHYFAFTVSDGTLITAYGDGASQGTTSTFTGTQFTSTNVPSIGKSGDNCTSTFDEVAFYSTALTSGQVSTHFNCGNAGTGCAAPQGNAGMPFSVKREPNMLRWFLTREAEAAQ